MIPSSLIKFCHKIGKNSLLVQGPGGNVSYKNLDVLWIKASGSWIAHAQHSNFVPIDLNSTLKKVTQKQYDFIPSPLKGYGGIPSIETLMHAVLPQKYVLHLHAVSPLAQLIKSDFNQIITDFKNDHLKFSVIKYVHPGPKLAKEIHSVLLKSPNTDIFFLRNHGIVLGAESLPQLEKMLHVINHFFNIQPQKTFQNYSGIAHVPEDLTKVYFPIEDPTCQQLAMNPFLFAQLKHKWALYPDHVVFLGGSAYCYRSWEDFSISANALQNSPNLIFVENVGVFYKRGFSEAMHAQLKCYADVLIRQEDFSRVQTLSLQNIAELINWDREKHRLSVN